MAMYIEASPQQGADPVFVTNAKPDAASAMTHTIARWFAGTFRGPPGCRFAVVVLLYPSDGVDRPNPSRLRFWPCQPVISA
jgi:hypothetical protein